jgi:seryl-tRNA(Sec) selenium transferase
MKIGKEEMVGLLAAVEMWVQRDHQKEDETWTQWMQTISDRVTKVDGVSAVIRQPKSIDNHSPSLAITWDPAKLGITGRQLADLLWTTEPRISVGRLPDAPDNSGVSITAYMMHPDEVEIVAGRLHEIFSAKRPAAAGSFQPSAGDLTGRWDADPAAAGARLTHSTSSKAISLSGRIKAISRGARLHRYDFGQ